MDMHTMTLSDTEQALLVELLEAELNELPHEIHHTDNHDYRELLEQKEHTLMEFLKKVKEA